MNLLRLVAKPEREPVFMEEAKSQSRVLHDHEDGLIRSKIAAWRGQAEAATQRALITQTWEWIADDFPEGREPIALHRPPVQSIESVVYADVDGTEQTLAPADYVLVQAEPALVYPAPGSSWPSVQDDNPMAVKVTFVAGYGPEPDDVPEGLRDAIIIGVATGYSHREDVVAGQSVAELNAIDALWDQFRWDSGVG